MSIIYDGVLQTYVAEYIKDTLKDYGHVIEMYSLPPNWNEWIKDNLVDYTSTSENCMGQSSVRQTKSYCIIHRQDKSEPLFLFLRTQKEKNAVVQAFFHLVLSEKPFKTLI